MTRRNWLRRIARPFVVLFALGSTAPAQAAAPPDRVALLVAQLGSDDFQERTAASAALERIGLPALRALRRAAVSPDAEVRRRARALLPVIEKREGARAVKVLQRV